MKRPNLSQESYLWEKNFLVCGIDEVGRGSFAGPLVAAGVVLRPDLSKDELSKLSLLGVNDSKLLSEKNRKKIIKNVQSFIFFSTIQYIQVSYINRFGINMANKIAFRKVAKTVSKELKTDNLFFLSDYFHIPKIKQSRQHNIIRGDQISISIALASIIAKVERDLYMERLSSKFPEYCFESNKGYGTKFHRKALMKMGLSKLHRKKFCKNYLYA